MFRINNKAYFKIIGQLYYTYNAENNKKKRKFRVYNRIRDAIYELFMEESEEFREMVKYLESDYFADAIFDFNDTPEGKVGNALQNVQYKPLLIPSPGMIKEVSEKISGNPEKEAKLAKLMPFLSQASGGVAFIGKFLEIDDKGNKRIIYGMGITTDTMKTLGFKKDMSPDEKRILFKGLTAVIYHEVFGHGKLGHLETNFAKLNPFDANIIEDLVINTKGQAIIPEAFVILKERIGGVYSDTWMEFSDEMYKRYLLLHAITNPDGEVAKSLKENFPDFYDDKAQNSLKERIGESLANALDVLGESFNENIDKKINELKKKYSAGDIKDAADEVFTLITELSELYRNNSTEIPSVFYERIPKFLDEIYKVVDEFTPKIISDKVGLIVDVDPVRNNYVAEKSFKKQLKERVSQFLQLITSPFTWEWGENPPDGGGGKGKKQQFDQGDDPVQGRGGPIVEPGEGPGGGPFENGEDPFEAIPDDFSEELDPDEAEQLEKVLEETLNESLEKIDDDERRRGKTPGKGSVRTEERLEAREKTSDELRRMLSELINGFLEIPGKVKEKIKIIPSIPQHVLEQAVKAAKKIGRGGAVFGETAIEKYTPISNILFSMTDNSGSMSNREIGIYKGALIGSICKRDDSILVDTNWDYSFTSLAVYSPQRSTSEKKKALNEISKRTGVGGTGNFNEWIKGTLTLDDKKVSRGSAEYVKRLKEELKKEGISEEQYKELVKQGRIKFTLLTDSDVIFTPEFWRDKELWNTLEEINPEKPIILVIAARNEDKNYIESKVKREKKEKFIRVISLDEL